MLEPSTKDIIQNAYRSWLAARGLQGRRGQREMVAEIARTVSADAEDDRILAIEAGTGTGKTIAYLIATLPVARQRDRRLIISTATLNLQEQLVTKDLPDLAEHAELPFTYELAKGRGRYVCPQRLANRASGGGDQANLPLDLLALAPPDSNIDYDDLLDAFISGRWNGEREALSVEVADGDWVPVTTDHRGCTGRRCKFFKQCPYFLARQRIDVADVIVANHDLVLADLALGGGAVLPAPEQAIYVFDEAHHLANKAQSHFSLSASVGGSRAWLDTVNAALGTMSQQLGRPKELMPLVERVIAALPDLGDQLTGLEALLAEGFVFESLSDGRRVHRFEHGAPPDGLVELSGGLASSFLTIVNPLDDIAALLESVLDDKVVWPKGSGAEDWFPVAGALSKRATDVAALFADFGNPTDRPGEPPRARWLGLRGEVPRQDLELVSVPVAVGGTLADVLWRRCDAAVLTSATLTALGEFETLKFNAGLAPAVRCVRLASPFDYPRVGTLCIPKMRHDPTQRDEHLDEISQMFPKLLGQADATLALFTSWYQLRAVQSSLTPELRERVLAQGDLARGEIIARHCERIDAGEPSVVFGVASFAEGVDLPGDYCTHVIIAKLPFPVPDDPVAAGLYEWLEAQGRNPFMEVSVPEASVRLVQACGRLIRSREDTGRVTLLDRRIVTRRYGRQLLAALPPFRQEIE